MQCSDSNRENVWTSLAWFQKKCSSAPLYVGVLTLLSFHGECIAHFSMRLRGEALVLLLSELECFLLRLAGDPSPAVLGGGFQQCPGGS